MSYALSGSMKTHPGQRDAVIGFVLAGVEQLRAAGCLAYLVAEGDEDEVVIFEVWESKQHHTNSLQIPEVRSAIAQAMPLLTGEFNSRELNVVGGLGLQRD